LSSNAGDEISVSVTNGLVTKPPHHYKQRLKAYQSAIWHHNRVENAYTEDRGQTMTERDFRLIVDSIPDLVFTMTPRGELEFVNQEILNFFGKSREELNNWAGNGIVHPDDLERVLMSLQRAIQSEEPHEVPHRIRRHDGMYRWCRLRSRALRDPQGRIVRWYSTITDIDDLKRAETELQVREADFREIIDSIPGFVATMTRTGAVEFVSQPILDYTGWKLDQLTNWAPLVHPEDLPHVAQSWRHSVETGAPWNSDHRLLGSHGEYRWFQHRGVARRDAEGNVIRWYVLLWDIHDRKHTEQALADSQIRLSQASQIATVGELAASIAHEVNQPLAAVVANGHACVRWLSAEPPRLQQAREAAERVVRDGKDAGEVVRRIRALFKRDEMDKAPLDLKDVIGEVLDLMQSEIAKRHVTVHHDLDPILPQVVGDRVQLQQLILNLILNGLEAMDPVNNRMRRLTISARAASDGVCVTVGDSGEGLKDPEKVFEPFFTTKKNGMGMGLAICRTITEAHGGFIKAEPNEGPGARISFTLPYPETSSTGAER
jgi:PAS domain S-box-containing protein